MPAPTTLAALALIGANLLRKPKKEDRDEKMKTYRIEFFGKPNGTSKARDRLTETIRARSEEAAMIKLYEKYEIISVLSITVFNEE